MLDKIESFADESIAYFMHFNAAKENNDKDNSCITKREIVEMLPVPLDSDAICSKYYEAVYRISEYWWYQYKLPNCGFDFDSYLAHPLNGPAFDGKNLFWQDTSDITAIQPMYVWYNDNACHFSLHDFDNKNPSESGACEIDGHKSIGSDYDLKSISLWFNDDTEHEIKLEYQHGQWGPSAIHTELRFYGLRLHDSKGKHEFWLWEQTEEHCDACDRDGVGYPDA